MRARTSSGARRRLWLSVACAAATVHGAGGAASGSNPTATNRGTAPAEATVPGPSPAQILARYIQASGGEALRGVATETRRGTLLRGVTGKVPLRSAAQSPGRFLYHQVFAFGEQVRFGCDGARAWVQDARGVADLDPRQARDLGLLLDPQAPLRLAEIYPHLEYAGAETTGEREADVVAARTADGAVTHLAFDRETGLLSRIDSLVLTDYREVSGFPRPFRVLLGESDADTHLQMTMEFAEIALDGPVDPQAFQRPTDPLPATEAPLYKSRQAVAVSREAMDACTGVYQHPDKPEVTYTVTRQGEHLMLLRTGWHQEAEIQAASETDYFVAFPGADFRFLKDDGGLVTHMEIRADRTIVAKKIR